MKMKSEAVVFTEKNRVEIRTVNLRKPGPGEILVKTKYSCISPGTELRCLRGMEKNASPFPIVPGYSLSGTVLETGSGVKTMKPGDMVFSMGTADAGDVNVAWGGHISHAISREEDLVSIPDGIPLDEACITALAAISFHGVSLSRPLPNEKVIIVGLGIIGRLSTSMHRLSGAEVIACDASKERVEMARKSGITALVAGENFAAELKKVFPDGADIVVDATGSPAVTGKAMSFAKDVPWDNSLSSGARFLVQGSYEDSLQIPYNTVFNKEITVLFPRANQKRDRLAVMNLMKRKLLNMKDLITGLYPFGKAPECYEILKNPSQPGTLTFVLQWN